jgi:hypothetical protein
MSQHRRLALVPTPAPTAPHDLDALTRAIADGELDRELLALHEAIAQRLDTLTTRSTAAALLELSPGDRVEINHTARPKYLHGERGTVVGLAGQDVIVSLDRPVERFRSGALRVTPSAWTGSPPFGSAAAPGNAARRSPPGLNAVCREARIGRDDRHPLEQRLRDEQAIEGIAMVFREPTHLPGMLGADRKPAEPAGLDMGG